MELTERGRRSHAFDKIEALIGEMQDTKTGVPVRSQKQFLTSIPSAFTGYDLVQWLIERFKLDEQAEAINIANQLCYYGYIFPVNDPKNLIVKDDSSLYRFQIPYYWPTQHRAPDNVEYAIYLCKRSLRNKQRHALEEYELEALNCLRKNLANKWEFITIQAEEQVKITKDRKKGEKIVSDSQEKAYWRIHRPPPGYTSSMEPTPYKIGGSHDASRQKSIQDLQKELEYLKEAMNRTRVKASVAMEGLVQYEETYSEYDPILTGCHPSNPWITDDPTYWQINSTLVEVPSEKRVKRWEISMEDLVGDPTGLIEFTNYLRKEYSHENIRFWMAAKQLQGCSQNQIQKRVQEIYEEFLAPGAPCEVNIDSKTMERTLEEMKNPSRYTFEAAAEHVYTLLLKKDCYPRFVRSDHYKNLLTKSAQPQGRKKFDFFGFGAAQGKNKGVIGNKGPCGLQAGMSQNMPGPSGISGKRRGSDRSLTGSTQELAVNVKNAHSHSNIADGLYRTTAGGSSSDDGAEKLNDDICPWDAFDPPDKRRLQPSPSNLMDESTELLRLPCSRKNSTYLDSSSSSDVSLSVLNDLTEKLKRTCILQETISRLGRRSSSTANSKQEDSTRPSVSSTEDLTTTPFRSFDSNPASSDREEPSTRRRSIGLFSGRKHSVSNTPMISVSSVTEQCDLEAHAEYLDLVNKMPSVNMEEIKDIDSDSCIQLEIDQDVQTQLEAERKSRKSIQEPLTVPCSVESRLSVPNKEESKEQIKNEKNSSEESREIPEPKLTQKEDHESREKLLEKTKSEELPQDDKNVLNQKLDIAVNAKIESHEDTAAFPRQPSVNEAEAGTSSSDTILIKETIVVEEKGKKSNRIKCKTSRKIQIGPSNKKTLVNCKDSSLDDGKKSSTIARFNETAGSSSSKPNTTDAEVCPWEDEEQCKMDNTAYVKTYETLGFI